MRRRDFLGLIGGAAAWPLAARAQQGRVRRIGWLFDRDEYDAVAQTDRSAFRDALAKFGWNEGNNLQIETRFGVREVIHTRAAAAELVALAPEVIVTNGIQAVQEL